CRSPIPQTSQAFAPELEPACEGHARPARSWSGATCTSASGQMPMRKAYLLSPRARIGRRGNTVPDSRTYGHPLRGVSVSGLVSSGQIIRCPVLSGLSGYPDVIAPNADGTDLLQLPHCPDKCLLLAVRLVAFGDHSRIAIASPQTLSALAMISPSGPSFIHSTVTTMLLAASRFVASWAAHVPVREVWPRGLVPSMPQWWTMMTAHSNAVRIASAALT